MRCRMSKDKVRKFMPNNQVKAFGHKHDRQSRAQRVFGRALWQYIPKHMRRQVFSGRPLLP
jgi:hypothetical protein